MQRAQPASRARRRTSGSDASTTASGSGTGARSSNGRALPRQRPLHRSGTPPGPASSEHPGDSTWTSFRATAARLGPEPSAPPSFSRSSADADGARVEPSSDSSARGRERVPSPWHGRRRDPQVSVYSGPEPPSGGVRRPPFAVIAPHWTQFEGLSLTLDEAVVAAGARPRRPAPGTSAPTARRAPPARFVATRMWFGWSSRVRLPERNTDESLSNVSVPSGAGYDAARSVDEDLLLGVALRRAVARREPPRRHRREPGERRPAPEARAERLPHVPHLPQVAPHERRRAATRRSSAATRRAPRARAPATPPRPRAGPTRPRSGSPSAPARSRAPPRRPRSAARAPRSCRGSATNPPSGIVFAPHATRSPPSRIGRIRGWVFSSCSRSCTESAASR